MAADTPAACPAHDHVRIRLEREFVGWLGEDTGLGGGFCFGAGGKRETGGAKGCGGEESAAGRLHGFFRLGVVANIPTRSFE